MRYNKIPMLVLILFLGLMSSACGQKRPLTLAEPAPSNQTPPATADAKTREHKE